MIVWSHSAKLRLCLTAVALMSTATFAQQLPPEPIVPAEPPADAALEVIKVQGNVWMIAGAGGNIAVQAGEQGVVVVDTGAAGVSDQVIAAIRSISTKPIRYIISTSIAAQHVGGNAALATLPGGSTTGGTRGATPAVIAQENILNRMTRIGADAKTVFPSGAWPTDGYFAPRRSLTFNGEAIDVIHLPNAFSDGDSAVYFRGSNVLVAGDVYTTTSLPMVNRALGGTYAGLLAGLNALLDITVPDDLAEGGTYVIPGHGRISDEADLVEYRDMVFQLRDRLAKLITADRKTLADVKAARPVIGWEARYSHPGWTTDMFLEAVYPEFAPPAAAPRPRTDRR
jgi:glyoxylase-like metal-dependent hydrolase (beta-lactamase superfamily II)